MWHDELTAFCGWLTAADRSPRTIHLRAYWLHRFVAEMDAGDPYAVDQDTVVEWLCSSDWAAETRKSAQGSLRVFYAWAVRTGRLPADRDPTRSLLPVSVPRGAPRPVPSVRLQRALARATDRDRLMLKLGALAGMRRGEIAAFHPRHVDRERARIRITGKGGFTRNVPLHPDLRIELDAEDARRAAGECGTGYRYQRHIAPGGWYFPGQTGDHLTAGQVGVVLAGLLGDDWTAHTVRHWFATKAYAANNDLRAVQELLGHSKPETTAIYTLVPQEATITAVFSIRVAS